MMRKNELSTHNQLFLPAMSAMVNVDGFSQLGWSSTCFVRRICSSRESFFHARISASVGVAQG